jgi:hypothetical protein
MKSKMTEQLAEYRELRAFIEDGVASAEPSFPFLVKMVLVGPTEFKVMCGGIALSDRVVLTATHCLNVSNFILPANSTDLLSYTRIASRGELALIKTVGGLLPAKFPGARVKIDAIPANSSFVALGWGGPQISSANPQLRRSNLLSLEASGVCEALYAQSLAANELCIGRAGMSPCRRDSGGPVFIATGTDLNPVLGDLVGVVRTADRDCRNTGPAIIAGFNDPELHWIQSNL